MYLSFPLLIDHSQPLVLPLTYPYDLYPSDLSHFLDPSLTYPHTPLIHHSISSVVVVVACVRRSGEIGVPYDIPQSVYHFVWAINGGHQKALAYLANGNNDHLTLTTIT